jgi:hypothetical protein
VLKHCWLIFLLLTPAAIAKEHHIQPEKTLNADLVNSADCFDRFFLKVGYFVQPSKKVSKSSLLVTQILL